MRFNKFVLAAWLCVADASFAISQLPTGTRSVRTFVTHEGTWMNVDVAPNGQTIAFDLLGDIYTLPITGGLATRLTSGSTIDAEPRFSPDGKTILFVRSSIDNDSASTGIWLMDA